MCKFIEPFHDISLYEKYVGNRSITDGVHRNENFVKIIPVLTTFSNFFKKEKKI